MQGRDHQRRPGPSQSGRSSESSNETPSGKPAETGTGSAASGYKAAESGRPAQPFQAPSNQVQARDPDAGDDRGTGGRGSGEHSVYAALDLGTNNCRLLIAKPTRRGFHVVDAFSRIVRLGEGVSATGRLSDAAATRAIDALRICQSKITRQRVSRSMLVATEACRVAANGPQFIDRVREQLGLDIEILSREDEAKLAVCGCASLIDIDSDYAMVFDIGGGSSELIWLDLKRRQGYWRRSLADRLDAHTCIAAWTSLPVGVVSMAERFDGRNVTEDSFEQMVAWVTGMIEPFEKKHRISELIARGRVHLLGTSGTVTTIAGILLGLPRYDRNRVDGCWLSTPDVRAVTRGLLMRSYAERVAEPCIGAERADLVLAGCAILEALLRMWPARRLRVADRGLREGILATLMAADGHFRERGPRRDPQR